MFGGRNQWESCRAPFRSYFPSSSHIPFPFLPYCKQYIITSGTKRRPSLGRSKPSFFGSVHADTFLFLMQRRTTYLLLLSVMWIELGKHSYVFVLTFVFHLLQWEISFLFGCSFIASKWFGTLALIGYMALTLTDCRAKREQIQCKGGMV